jgi:aminoglycoside 2'-N-acetyltransferase I
VEIRVDRTEDLAPELATAIRAMLLEAFDHDFGDEDWEHALGGWHATAVDGDGVVVAHAALVERTLEVGGRAVRAGYVEAVATAPSRRRSGHGSAVMRRLAEVLLAEFEMGALSTGEHAFYEQLGWERWQGPAFVRRGDRVTRTEDEDDGIMVLRHGSSAQLELTAAITCEERPGDDW